MAASKKCSKEQVVVQLRGMHLMIGAALKSEYEQVVVKTQTNTYIFFSYNYESFNNKQQPCR